MRAEAHLALRAEEGAHQVQERPLEIGHRDAAVDREPLDLVEDRYVGRVGCLATVDAPERDDVDGRLLLLHDVDLRGRGLGAQQHVAVQEDGLERRARRVVGREVEGVEVVARRLDLATVHDLVAEAEEDVLDLAPDLRDEVVGAHAARSLPAT